MFFLLFFFFFFFFLGGGGGGGEQIGGVYENLSIQAIHAVIDL